MKTAKRITMGLGLSFILGMQTGCQKAASEAVQAQEAGALSPPEEETDFLRLPPDPRPDPNGYTEFKLLSDKLQQKDPILDLTRSLLHGGAREYAPADLQAAAHVVEANQANLRELNRILEMEWWYPGPYSPEDMHPEVSKAYFFSLILCLQAVLNQEAGNTDAAVSSLLQALRLGGKLPRGGTYIAWTISVVMEFPALRELKPLIAQGHLSDHGLQSLLSVLQDLAQQRVPLWEAIAFEYHCQGPAALKLEPTAFWELLGSSPPTWAENTPATRQAMRELIQQRLPSLRAYDATLAELATQPYYEIRDRIPEEPEDLPSPGDSLVLQPVPSGVLRKQAEGQCQWRAVRLMLHLEQARRQQGEYVATLAQLPGVSPSDRVDPFSGQPFRYRIQDGGYQLYSVGWDGLDGGRVKGVIRREPGWDLLLWPLPE